MGKGGAPDRFIQRDSGPHAQFPPDQRGGRDIAAGVPAGIGAAEDFHLRRTEHAGQMRQAAQTVRAATPRCSHPVLEKNDLCGEAATEALTRDEWRMAHEILRNSSQEYCPTHVVVVLEWMGRFLAEGASREAVA